MDDFSSGLDTIDPTSSTGPVRVIELGVAFTENTKLNSKILATFADNH